MAKRMHGFVAAGVSLSLTVTPVLARSAGQLSDLVGARGSSGENELEARGFSHAKTDEGGDARYSYWWHAGDKNCVRVETRDGRYQSITDARDGDCGHGGMSTGAAVAAVAGVALIGALLASKANKDAKKDYSQQQSQDYDRGYSDGYYNAQYNNYGNSSAYDRGYRAGVDQRGGNGNGNGYGNPGYRDLIGARAAGATDELDRRGYAQVDNYASGNRRYSIRWREPSRECIQVTVASGRINDIRDIGSHPRCRSGSFWSGGNGNGGGNWYTRLVGAADSGARSQLQNNGYRQVDSFSSGRNGYGTVWYNRNSRQCLQMIVVNGRVDSAMDIQSHPRCR